VKSPALYATAPASLQATIMKVALAVLIMPVAHGGSRFELGQMQQATSVTRAEYVVPVTVSADGYSTFSASIYASQEMMQRLRWQSIERQSGVNVVISVTKPIIAPTRITLVVRYQGRERMREYWLQPVSVRKQQPGIPEAVQPDVTGQKQANNTKPGQSSKCRELLIKAGSLYANIKRLTAGCGHRFGIWHPGNSQHLVDWIVESARLLENNEGVAGLLDMLQEDYGLLGVIRREGNESYIDYHELPGSLQ